MKFLKKPLLIVLFRALIGGSFIFIYISGFAFAIEPIGIIGQPFPEEHAFLPDGDILRAVPTHIQVIDPQTGAVTDEFGERTPVSDVVFSPTATHLAILNYDVDRGTTTVNVWAVNAREQTSQWEIAARSSVAAFSPTEPLLAISSDNEIHLWNWQTGESIGMMIGERRPSETCYHFNNSRTCTFSAEDHASVFSPDGRHLIVASTRPDIELWNIKTRRLEGHFEGHTGNWVEDVVISPDGTYIATFEQGPASVYVWDMESRQLLRKIKSGTGTISDFVFSPDSQHLYVASKTFSLSRSNLGPWQGWDDQVRVWDVNSGQQVDTFGSEFRILKEITLSADGKTMLLHYWDAVVLWNIATKKQLRVWADFAYGWDNALSPDGRTLASTSAYFIKTWDIPSQQMRLLISAEGERFRKLAISPNGQKLAIDKDPWIEVRDLQTGKVETQFQHTYGIDNFAFSASGRWIAAEGWGYIFIFDLENPETVQQLVPPNRNHSISTHWITFHENDEYLVSFDKVDNDRRILLWKREDDTFVFHRMWQMPYFLRSAGSDVRLNADGSILLALFKEGELQIWMFTPTTIEVVATLPDVDFPAHFSADGRYLFTNRDDNLQIWDWQSETPLEHPSIPDYFDISEDRSILTSHAETGQIQIWDGTALLPSQPLQPVAVEPGGKQIVILGAVKRNQLLQNFPNPFNPETWIPFRLANESYVTIHIHNSTGQLVRHLFLGSMLAGDYSSQSQAIHWDGRNQTGEPVSSGVYLYTINAGDFTATRKMLIRK